MLYDTFRTTFSAQCVCVLILKLCRYRRSPLSLYEITFFSECLTSCESCRWYTFELLKTGSSRSRLIFVRNETNFCLSFVDVAWWHYAEDFIFNTESMNTFFTYVLSAEKLLLLQDVVSGRDSCCRWNMYFDHYLFKTLWISFYVDNLVENSWDSFTECPRDSFHAFPTFTLINLVALPPVLIVQVIHKDVSSWRNTSYWYHWYDSHFMTYFCFTLSKTQTIEKITIRSTLFFM